MQASLIQMDTTKEQARDFHRTLINNRLDESACSSFVLPKTIFGLLSTNSFPREK